MNWVHIEIGGGKLGVGYYLYLLKGCKHLSVSALWDI
jgi:hypothetical protein